jgi:hypothetical protein
MAVGDFEAVVKITKSSFGSGFYNGVSFFDASMELEGNLIVFRYGNLDGRDARLKNNFLKKTWVSINIKFTEKPEIDERLSNDKKQYIGGIYYNENEEPLLGPDGHGRPLFEIEDRIAVRVDIILPCFIFSRLLPMEGRDIHLTTWHDVVANPEHHCVGLVTAAHFEVYPVTDVYSGEVHKSCDVETNSECA